MPDRTLHEPAPGVAPELAAYHETLEQLTGLHLVGTRTRSAIGFGGNINFIEGDHGVIVVNTGTTLALSQQALELFRQVCDKPIVALIYTHGYFDHTGGARVFVSERLQTSVEVYANAAWHGHAEQASSVIQPEVSIRAASQVGWLLPSGVAGNVGNGLTRALRGGGGSSYVAPTIEIREPTKVRIAGVELELIPAPHDLDDGMIVWMPAERLMIGGDLLLLNDIYPPLATPRFEARRDPQKWIDSMALAASYNAEHLINAYGPPVTGAAEIRVRLLGQQRISQYMVDEVNRRILRGDNADVIAAEFALPEAVTAGRKYREYYHRLAWIIRSMIAREFGHFSGDVADLVKLSPRAEAAKLAEELGGFEQLIARATQAYEQDDHRWSLQLATYALKITPDHPQARALRHHCMRALAYRSDSANERNYLLTSVALETGAIQRSALLRQISGTKPSDIALLKPPSQMLSVMGHKLKIAPHGRAVFSVRLHLTDRAVVLDVTVLPAVLLRSANPDGSPPDLELVLAHDALIRGVEGMNRFDELRASGAVSVTGREEFFQRFMEAFEW